MAGGGTADVAGGAVTVDRNAGSVGAGNTGAGSLAGILTVENHANVVLSWCNLS